MNAQIFPFSEEQILWNVVEEHLDEAAFLWGQWERALISPLFSVRQVAERVERRLLAHVDGLVVGGVSVARRLLGPALTNGMADEACAAAWALLNSEDAAAAEAVFSALCVVGGRQRIAIARAIALSPGRSTEAWLYALLGKEDPELRAIALDALSFQRKDVRDNLQASLQDPAPAVARSALLAAARLAPSAHPRLVRRLLDDPEPTVREAALVTGALAGMREVLAVSRRLLGNPGPPSATALLLLALSEDPADRRQLLYAAAASKHQPEVVFALGFSGDAESAAACVELARNPTLTSLAGEAVVGITGVDLEQERLIGMVPPSENEIELPPLERECMNTELSVTSEDELPVPDPSALAAWWQQRGALRPGTRYLYGRPISNESLLDALAAAPMRRRHVLALDLAIRTGGEAHLETSGLAEEQMTQLIKLRVRIEQLKRPE